MWSRRDFCSDSASCLFTLRYAIDIHTSARRNSLFLSFFFSSLRRSARGDYKTREKYLEPRISLLPKITAELARTRNRSRVSREVRRHPPQVRGEIAERCCKREIRFSNISPSEKAKGVDVRYASGIHGSCRGDTFDLAVPPNDAISEKQTHLCFFIIIFTYDKRNVCVAPITDLFSVLFFLG